MANSVVTQREVGRDVLTFADGLRSGLRQDPDVILVGEIRDQETAQMALSAAETGHLVFIDDAHAGRQGRRHRATPTCSRRRRSGTCGRCWP